MQSDRNMACSIMKMRLRLHKTTLIIALIQSHCMGSRKGFSFSGFYAFAQVEKLSPVIIFHSEVLTISAEILTKQNSICRVINHNSGANNIILHFFFFSVLVTVLKFSMLKLCFLFPVTFSHTSRLLNRLTH